MRLYQAQGRAHSAPWSGAGATWKGSEGVRVGVSARHLAAACAAARLEALIIARNLALQIIRVEDEQFSAVWNL